ncbi:MAG TPA: hypothetical protein VIB39_08390 [Candidatus Angelobacter sp.]
MSHAPHPISRQPEKNRSFFLKLCLILLVVFAARGYSQTTCINQSPRDITLQKAELDAKPPVAGLDYNYTSATPLINPLDARTIQYQGQTLHLCDQHYHVPVENVQGCTNEHDGNPPDHGPPPVNQWIEFHSVYAMVVDSSPECANGPDNNLACCKTPPFVVRAFSAKVSAPRPSPTPVTQPAQGILAEWSGSNTGADKDGDCKPLPAQWSFRFGCEFTVSQNALEGHAHESRGLQPPKKLSSDLAVVGTPAQMDQTCREVRTAPIPDDAMAKKWACPATCKNPLNAFTGTWRNVPNNQNPQYALCTCCPLSRP